MQRSSPQPEVGEKFESMNTLSIEAQKMFSRKGEFSSDRRQHYDPLYQDLPALGPFKYMNGDTYEGQYKEGKITGFSNQIDADGSVYVGYCED